MSRGVILRECSICGAEFASEHGNKRMCPECTGVIKHSRGRRLPRTYDNPSNIENYESKMKARYMERYKDTIIAERYAARQIEATLAQVGKVRTEL